MSSSLTRNGVRIPWYRKKFLFHVGSIVYLVSLLVGFALVLIPQRKRVVRKKWMLVTRIILWLVITVLDILFIAALVLLGGMSHSGYPYDFVYPWFFAMAGVYIFLAILLRYGFPSRPRETVEQ